MELLNQIPEYIFETAGLLVGLGANFVIAIQVYKEYKSQNSSSLSFGYLIGWWFIFIFWFFYGVRFNAVAISISNGLATIIQTILIFVVRNKSISKEKES